MTAEALATLKALAQRARAVADAAAANEVLAEAATIAHDESLPASRGLGLVLLDIASTLVPLGAPGAVEDLFLCAQRVFEASSDSRVDDQLLLWHNVGVLYGRHGATELLNRTLELIGACAESYTGPLDRASADVFLEQGLTYRRSGRTGPMLVMMRQVHRYRSSDAVPPAERLQWLDAYASLLIDAGQGDAAAPVLAQGIELAKELRDAEREAQLLNTSASVALSRKEVGEALAALERARQVIESAPVLADTKLAAVVLHNLVAARLNEADPGRYPEVAVLGERAIEIMRRTGLADSDEFAFALYHRAVLTEYLGDWSGAARGYSAAAAVPHADAAAATEWLSLAGRAWFEAGEFDAASDCHLAAVRRRVKASAAVG